MGEWLCVGVHMCVCVYLHECIGICIGGGKCTPLLYIGVQIGSIQVAWSPLVAHRGRAVCRHAYVCVYIYLYKYISMCMWGGRMHTPNVFWYTDRFNSEHWAMRKNCLHIGTLDVSACVYGACAVQAHRLM